jgi:putative NADH-flavin reductase
MKLAIFGATGETGKQLVKQALEKGNKVTSYVRNPQKLNIEHECLTIIQGELTNKTAIENAISGVDVVISVLGPRSGSKSKPITQGMQNVIPAMEKQNIRRLIISSTLSLSDPDDLPDFKSRVLINLVKLINRAVYEEIISVGKVVRSSNLDWTIIRLPLLNNNPKSGKVKVGYLGRKEVGLKISRADIADFMLKQVQDKKYIRKAPAISN